MDWNSWLNIFRLFSVVATAIALFSYIGTWCCGVKIEKSKNQVVKSLRSDLDSLASEKTNLASKLKIQEDDSQVKDVMIRQINNAAGELQKGQDRIVTKNLELITQIEKHKAELKDKNQRIQQLEVKVQKTSQGITSTYDFNGTRRESSHGRNIATAGPEYSIFATLVRLQEEKDFEELARTCKSQIKKNPDWLTPHLFLGIALANSGQKDVAIKEFEYVSRNAPDDPDYADAARFAKELRKQ